MSLTGAEQAVSDYLITGPGPVIWSRPSPGGWAASTSSGGGMDADPATIRHRKTRAYPDCQLHWVEFTTRDGRPEGWLVRTSRVPDGSWAVSPIGGGGPGPYRSTPWVNFAVQWNADLFAAGGQVTGEGAQAAHLVRLTFSDGSVLADPVHEGVVLFYASPGVAFPARAEILSAAGDLLAEYDEFNELE